MEIRDRKEHFINYLINKANDEVYNDKIRTYANTIDNMFADISGGIKTQRKSGKSSRKTQRRKSGKSSRKTKERKTRK